MKKVLFLAVVLLLCMQTVAFAESKIGAVSMQGVLVNCDYGKAMEARMKAKFEPLQKELEKEAAAIQKLESELKNQDLALKLEAKQDKQREYRRKVRDHQDSAVAFRQKLQAETQKLQQPILEKIIKVINEYGKANGYSMILEMRGVTLFVSDAVDITNNVVDELNKLKKAGK
ncbi:OmpH family outer membrane protein [Pseudodesulfovibrio sp. zrk46]|uniref:OmpH family outer membrane protein n=1 Tax=Pseudodesulfovibrio sp. zrk46 TaxID=2725288 RepID=UPI00144A264E|nr:OmpH family outer membrane protein [Pseudodesulfovibrio sp. zrk46]QJB57585.1 OmpH family outer membrane protein [Pseudodesulfovibrio sp. zrk46]